MFVGMRTENSKPITKTVRMESLWGRPKAVNSTRAASKPLLPASEAA